MKKFILVFFCIVFFFYSFNTRKELHRLYFHGEEGQLVPVEIIAGWKKVRSGLTTTKIRGIVGDKEGIFILQYTADWIQIGRPISIIYHPDQIRIDPDWTGNKKNGLQEPRDFATGIKSGWDDFEAFYKVQEGYTGWWIFEVTAGMTGLVFYVDKKAKKKNEARKK